MSVEEKKKLLALHRLQQAVESLQEAQYLFAGGQSLRSVVNRLYYVRNVLRRSGPADP